jgi:hypothetical protein
MNVYDGLPVDTIFQPTECGPTAQQLVTFDGCLYRWIGTQGLVVIEVFIP